MATRSNIRVVLKEEDRNKDLKFAPNEKQAEDLKENEWGVDQLEEGMWETVNPEGAEALMIYHHWDGYIKGVGKTLIEKYDSYEDALNLVLGGDCSSINRIYTPYATRKYEDWESIMPRPISENHKMEEEYDYMFKGDQWYVRGGYDEGCDDWTPLEKFFADEEDIR
jgi:hypothetical protein